ncbi:MAG: hypothetical protein ACR2N4_11060 [Jatrophihabitans sp.]
MTTRVLRGALTLACLSGLAVLAQPADPAGAAPVCASSASLVPLQPARISFLHPYASLQATNGAGLWAGVRFDGLNGFQVITWQAGRVRVLDTLTYRNTSYDDLDSVRVVGVSSAGTVVVSAQPTTASVESGRRVGLRYQNGRRYLLQSSPLWRWTDPTGITADGRVVGAALRTNGAHQVLQWSASGVGTVSVLAATGALFPSIDALGDVAYTYQDATTQYAVLRLPNGNRLNLGGKTLDDPTDAVTTGAAGPYVYGREENTGAVVRWNLTGRAGLPTGTLLSAEHLGLLDWFTAAGSSGAVVGQQLGNRLPDYGQRLLRDSIGDLHPLPAEYQYTYSPHRPVAVAPTGTLAYTGTDGGAHFFSCTLNPASHNPAGVIVQAINLGGSVRIRGAAADRDDYAAPVTIQIYDVTGTRRLVAQLSADLPSAGYDASLHIGGDHGFGAQVDTGPGSHRYCVYAINLGPGTANTSLGCLTLPEHGLPGAAAGQSLALG